MAVTLEGGCRVSEMREGEPVVSGPLRVWHRIGRATGAQAIALRVMEFGPGLSPTIQNENCDQILYMLGEVRTACDSGRATLLIDGQSHGISPDTGIYIRPNQNFAIDNPGSNSLVIISAQCPDPDHAPRFIEPAVASSDSTRSNQPAIVRLADQRAQPTADRWYRVLVDEQVGSEQVTQFVGSIPPGRAPDHFHEYEEVLFILKGEGRMWAGETNTPISSGSCIYLPKGQVHCVENTGTGELRLLGVFYPAGSPSVRYES
ncbi:MAG TPA: cupin domain-containing protein [Pyrinomonadaceae bacterium]|nr:cupin domain-containing protein [Pyrinomonadaceae bacterium]